MTHCMLLQVPMRGSKLHMSDSVKHSHAAKPMSAAGGAVDASLVCKPPTSKLRQLAAQQLAILRASAKPRCAVGSGPLLASRGTLHVR